LAISADLFDQGESISSGSNSYATSSSNNLLFTKKMKTTMPLPVRHALQKPTRLSKNVTGTDLKKN
jgi:hypothetical protein